MKRLQTVDAAKGLAILLVVLGHSMQADNQNSYLSVMKPENLLMNIIYTFHMPLFMFLSGYVLFKAGKPMKYRPKYLLLLIPFFSWGILYAWWNNFVWWHGGTLGLSTIPHLIKHPENGLWYLWVLNLSLLILFASSWVAARLKPASAKVAAYLLPLALMLQHHNSFGLLQLRMFYVYFLVGYFAHAWWPKVAAYRNEIMLIAGGVYAGVFIYAYQNLYIFSSPLDFLQTNPVIPLTRYTLGICGIVLAVGLVRSLSRLPVYGWLSWLGLYTLDIYVLEFLFFRNNLAEGWIKVGVAFALGVFGPLLLSVLVLHKNRYTMLLLLGRLRQSGRPVQVGALGKAWAAGRLRLRLPAFQRS
jgi:fucose 4-O-acetylase-like acetyltransferase